VAVFGIIGAARPPILMKGTKMGLNSARFRSLGVAVCLGLGGVAVPLAVSAQSSFLEMGKGALQSLEKGKGGDAVLPGVSAGQGGGSGTLGANMSVPDISTGLKEALRMGSERVVNRLGKTDGFNADPAVHVPLPDSLKAVAPVLKMAGAGGVTADLETRLNRAAEEATPQARQIFVSALQAMTLDDARAILNGPKDAATQYFRRTMTPQLQAAMRPVVERSVADVGAVKALDAVASSAGGALPALDNPSAMLSDHVLGYALDGIFHYLAQEEAAIRADPAKQSTDLLRKLFAK
jgi:hypothetical protein